MTLKGEARREYARKWMADRRSDWFTGKVCVRCGTSARLELNHVDPSKKVSHRIWSWSDERRNAELAKCEPLCNICHKAVTANQRKTELVHGTYAGYRKGCRCDQCRFANTEYARELRLKKAC